MNGTGDRTLAAVILAAGKGVRLGAGLRKPARPMGGKPLVRWVVDACLAAGAEPVVVIVPPDSEDGKPVRQAVEPDAIPVVQDNPRGTGHALLQARKHLHLWRGDIVVLVGDAPAVHEPLIRSLLEHHRATNAAITFASGVYDPTPPYGRVLRDATGRVTGIVEEKEATPLQREIKEVITSQFVFRGELLWPLLERVKASPVTGEVQLTDVISIAARSSLAIEAWPCPEPERLLGVNTPEEWTMMETVLADSRDRTHVEKGS